MKLRIRGNSVRIRLTRSEVAALGDIGRAEDAVRFSPTDVLQYGVAVTATDALGVEFGDRRLTVNVPKAMIEPWLAPSEVTIEGSQPIGDTDELRILIEKDFMCLAPRAGEDGTDLFVNPAAAESK